MTKTKLFNLRTNSKGFKSLTFHSFFLKRRNFILLFPQCWKLFIQYQKVFCKNNKINLSSNQIQGFKIKKYFFSAGIAGAMASRCINGNDRVARINRFDYSLLFSYWAVLLINLDAYSDFEEKDFQKSINANLVIAKLVRDTIVKEGINIPDEKLKSLSKWIDSFNSDFAINKNSSLLKSSIYFCEKFSLSLVKCLNHVKSESIISGDISHVIDSMVLLMDAQISSLNQSNYQSNYDWYWYYNSVLKNKFDYIFITLLHVLPQNKTQIRIANYLLNGLSIVNELVLHRQILDDLIDFEKDIDCGILSTATYLLMAYDKNDINLTDDGLANKIFDRIKFLKIYIKGSFTESWKTDPSLSKKIVLGSQILNSYVEIIEDKERVNGIEKRINELILECPEISDCILIYYSREMRSLKRFKNKYSL